MLPVDKRPATIEELHAADRKRDKEILAAYRANRAAPPQTNAEREAERQAREQLRKDLDLTRRVVVKHGDDIRALRAQVQALQSAVTSLQRQRAPAAGQVRTRDHLDDELERGLITE